MTEYRLVKVEGIRTDLDPELQKLVLARREGTLEGAASCGLCGTEEEPRMEVIATLHEADEHVEGLAIRSRTGPIVTGTVAIDDIEAVRGRVISLRPATPLEPVLARSVPDIRADQASLRAGFPGTNPPFDGRGVIVGIVDRGCDFTHANFRNPDGSTRLLFLWDQRQPQAGGAAPADFGYGHELDSRALNDALSTQAPYLGLYHPQPGAHGTHVMDIAAGNGRVGAPGVAPGADLIFVNVEDSTAASNSIRLFDAVKYIFEKARALGKAAVVNVSLGNLSGPHDGSFQVEQGFELLLSEPGRALVIAAGNFFDRQAHTHREVPHGGAVQLAWRIPANDTTPNKMEIWYDGGSELEVSLRQPGSGQRHGPVRPGEIHQLQEANGIAGGTISHLERDRDNGDHLIHLTLGPGLPPGVWTVEVANPASPPVLIHAWIQRDDSAPSRFENGWTTTHTLSSIACGTKPIVVGAYNALDPNKQPMPFTSSGPTRDGRRKPDMSAPGHPVEAAAALGTTKRADGTSVAAPHVAGLAALLFQAGGRGLTNDRIKQALQGSARRNPPGPQPVRHLRYGHGRVDGVGALRQILVSSPQPAPVAVPPPAAPVPVGSVS